MDWKFTDKAFLAIVMTPRAVLPIKAALADRKKVFKTGSIFMGRGRGMSSRMVTKWHAFRNEIYK